MLREGGVEEPIIPKPTVVYSDLYPFNSIVSPSDNTGDATLISVSPSNNTSDSTLYSVDAPTEPNLLLTILSSDSIPNLGSISNNKSIDKDTYSGSAS